MLRPVFRGNDIWRLNDERNFQFPWKWTSVTDRNKPAEASTAIISTLKSHERDGRQSLRFKNLYFCSSVIVWIFSSRTSCLCLFSWRQTWTNNIWQQTTSSKRPENRLETSRPSRRGRGHVESGSAQRECERIYVWHIVATHKALLLLWFKGKAKLTLS